MIDASELVYKWIEEKLDMFPSFSIEPDIHFTMEDLSQPAIVLLANNRKDQWIDIVFYNYGKGTGVYVQSFWRRITMGPTPQKMLADPDFFDWLEEELKAIDEHATTNM